VNYCEVIQISPYKKEKKNFHKRFQTYSRLLLSEAVNHFYSQSPAFPLRSKHLVKISSKSSTSRIRLLLKRSFNHPQDSKEILHLLLLCAFVSMTSHTRNSVPFRFDVIWYDIIQDSVYGHFQSTAG
jgi:hypothetical protein